MRSSEIRTVLRIGVVAIFFLAAANSLHAQLQSQEEGDPFIRNYTSREYAAFFQNWCVAQDPRGLIYVANNQGVLEYDGIRWRLIRTDKGATVRTVAVDRSGRVYVGAQGELGYLAPNLMGEMCFVSLMDLLASADRAFSDIFSIHFLGERVYFQCLEGLFCFDRNRIRVFKPGNSFQYAGVVNDRLFVRDVGRGLLTLEGDQLRLLPGGEIFASEKICAMLPANGAVGEKGNILICTQNLGFFVFNDQQIKPFPTQADEVLHKLQANHALRLSDGTLAVATLQGGLLRLSQTGGWLNWVGEKEGLPIESVKFLCQDTQSGLWLALGRGISRVEMPSPLSYFDKRRGLLGTVFSIHRHRETLYVGTSQGLFRLNPVGPRGAYFSQIEGLVGAVWSLLSWEDNLLAANYDGVYEVHDSRAIQIRKSATTSYYIQRSHLDQQRLFIGMQNSLASLRWENGRWVDQGPILQMPIMVRNLVEEDDGSLWIGTYSNGILHVTFPHGLQNGHPRVENFGPAQGLPSLNQTYVHKLAGGIKTISHAGIYRYRPDSNRFEPDPAFAGLFPNGKRWVYALRPDSHGRIWMQSCDEARSINESGAAVPQPDGTYRWEGRPCLRFSGSWADYILPEDNDVVWFGTSDGLMRLDAHVFKAFDLSLHSLVRRISTGNGQLIFGGTVTSQNRATQIPFSDRRLHFEFAVPSFDLESANSHQVLLEGTDTNWSAWSADPYKDYTNLPEGHYRFRIHSRNLYGTLSSEGSYAFTVLPPWYRTWWAYFIWLISAGAVLLGVMRFYSRRLIRAKDHLQKVVAERTTELAFSNQQLEKINSIMQSINSEIDFSAMLFAIIKEISSVAVVDKAVALMRDKIDGAFRIKAFYNWEQSVTTGIALTLEETENRYVKNTVELAPDIYLVQHVKGRPAEEKVNHLELAEVMLVIRIRSEKQVEGYLVLENMRNPEAFSQQGIELLDKLKHHIGMAFTKAKLMLDLDEQREAAERANILKSQFLANMSHEIRTPMNAILGFAKILRDDETDSEKREQVEIINEAGENLLKLINDILDFSKIEADKLEINPLTFSPHKLLVHLQRMFEMRVKEKRISLEVELDKDVPEFLFGDSYRLNQVLINIVGNAVKFTKTGGIYIHCGYSQGKIGLAIRDTGIGIVAEKQAQVFEPFVQADGSTTRQYGGTGLGLAICQKIARLMGGTIMLKSEIGLGSIFTIVVPMPAAAPQDLAQALEFEKLDDSTRGKIIGIIEDNQNEIELIKTILKKHGYVPLHIDNNSSVVNTVLEKKVDLILLDLLMQGVDGFQINELLKRDFRTAHLPVMVVSGSPTIHDSLQYGIVDYIKKPFREDEMLKRIFVALKVKDDVKNVFVIDDDQNLLKLYGAYLRRYHFNAFTFATALDALASMKNGIRPDIIILDLMMPQVDGFQFLQRLRQEYALQVPVMIVTAKELNQQEIAELKKQTLTIINKGMNTEREFVSFLNTYFQRRLLCGEKLVKSWLDRMNHDSELGAILLDAVQILPKKIAELERALFANDRAQIEFIAHDIKGFSANMQMHEIAALAKEINDSVRQEDWPRDRVERLFVELKGLVETIAAGQYIKTEPWQPQGSEKAALKVLVAEDELVNRRLMATYFKRLGYACDFAANGVEVLQALRLAPYDLVFLDIQMPVMGGLETIRQIRDDNALKHTFVIALTAHAIKGDDERFLQAGFDEYLAKPVSSEALAEKLLAAVKRSQK